MMSLPSHRDRRLFLDGKWGDGESEKRERRHALQKSWLSLSQFLHTARALSHFFTGSKSALLAASARRDVLGGDGSGKAGRRGLHQTLHPAASAGPPARLAEAEAVVRLVNCTLGAGELVGPLKRKLHRGRENREPGGWAHRPRGALLSFSHRAL